MPDNANTPQICAGMNAALRLLRQGHEYALDLGEDVWAFSVGFDELRAAGTSLNDCRWLVAKGHVLEKRQGKLGAVSPSKKSLRPALTGASCFVLTPSGVQFARGVLDVHCSRNASDGACRGNDRFAPSHGTNGNGLLAPDPPARPVWDLKHRELRVGTVIVKLYHEPAPNQEAILAAFQEEDWPDRIDDPIPPLARRNPKRRLHAAITRLNQNQHCRLLKFAGNGNGTGVYWNFVEPESASRASTAKGRLRNR